MKVRSALLALTAALYGMISSAFGANASVNWSAGINHGFSLSSTASLPAGSLVQLGWFRDPATNQPLSDAQIQAVAGQVTLLQARFVSAASGVIGAGLNGIPEHFSISSDIDTATLGLVGRQMYIWVLNAPTAAAATEQAILYWDINDASNPDSAPIRPQLRWAFPAMLPVPGTTSIDLTDLTSGASGLGTGARVVIGTYPLGTSDNTSAPGFGLAVISNVLSINTGTPMVTGIRNQAYNQTLVSSGGAAPLTWSINSGSLPPGLTLDASTGEITGTPTTVGSSSFTIQVEDSAHLIGAKAFTMEIAEAQLSIVTDADLADGVLDEFYVVMLDSDGGSTPHTWSHTSGDLPPGLRLAADGELSGVPSAVGLFTFEATVTDLTQQRTQRLFNLSVTHTPTILGGSTLVPGVVGQGYTHQFLAADPRPYVWTVSGGTLPPGMTLSASGHLSGKPTAAGPYAFNVSAQGTVGPAAVRAYALTILATNVAPTLQIPTMPETMVGNSSFRQRIIASPSPSIIKAGGLPPGLVLDSKTGWITGNPTRAGVYTASIKATNAAGSSPDGYAVFTVKALPTSAVGSYNALISPVLEVNGMLGGRIDLTTAITGDYTLTLTQGSAVVKTKGVLTSNPSSINPRVIATIGNLKLNLILDSSTSNLTGSLSAFTSGGTPIPATITGWRQTWNTTLSSDPVAGFYTTALTLTSNLTDETVPQGAGAISVNVGRLGTTFISGKSAVGQVITTTGILAANGRILLYSRQDKNLGVIQGTFQITPNAEVALNRLNGSAIWRKGNSVTTTYPSAFGPVSLSASGGWMGNIDSKDKAVAGGRVLGLPLGNNVMAALTFTKGGLETASINPSINPITFQHHFFSKLPAITANLPAPGSTFNQASVSLKMSAQSGLFTGDFTLLDGGKKRKATYYGTVVRDTDASLKAVGHFLLPKMLQLGETGKPQILSGKVVITQPQP